MAIKLKQAFEKYQQSSPDPRTETDNPLLVSETSSAFSNSAPAPLSPLKKNPYISHPHQLRALQLTQKFNDPDHKIQYLNLCKSVHPTIIDQAESFVSDANANNKAALFMWKVKQIKLDWQKSNKDWHHPDKQSKPSKSSKSKKSRSPSNSTQQPDLFS